MNDLLAPFVDRLEAELAGPLAAWPRAAARRALERWVAQGLRWCEDAAWAGGFARACPVAGAAPADYLQRVLPVGGGAVLAGIRFKGGDVVLPFVDLVAWTVDPAGRWREVAAAVRAAFATFSPPRARLHLPAGAAPPPGAAPDLLLFAAPLSHLRGPCDWPPGVRVERAAALDDFDRYTEEMAAWQAQAGPLGREVHAESRGSLEGCVRDGALVTLRVEGRWAGLAAARRGDGWACEGFEVVEELVAAPFRGRGLAPWLQRGLIDALDPSGDPLLWGTIHASNAPSQATARRCGRAQVGASWFVDLA
ncbi:MAG: hypothetical protein M9894_13975 [Planctomycetes bacterium]|nr:hypothetical protein [Planctomycetota bacterium]